MAEEHYVSQDDLRMVLRAELAEFKLDILGSLKELATKAEVENLVTRISVIEKHGSPQSQAIIKALGETEANIRANEVRLGSIEDWRNRMFGVYLVLAFEIPVLATISWHLWG